MSCHHKKFLPEEAKYSLGFLSFTKGSAHCLDPPSSKGNLYDSFPLTKFSPTQPPFLEKFKSYKKVKLSHSYFPELTVNIWLYFSSFFNVIYFRSQTLSPQPIHSPTPKGNCLHRLGMEPSSLIKIYILYFYAYLCIP